MLRIEMQDSLEPGRDTYSRYVKDIYGVLVCRRVYSTDSMLHLMEKSIRVEAH